MVTIENLVASINNILWNYILIFLLCGTGIYFTFGLKFIQVFEFFNSIKKTFNSISLKGKSADKKGMSSFQSLATSIAGQVGTGNLAGAATALIYGGPGAIFWLWVSAFFGMATIFAEATLAQKYKTELYDGSIIGGPAYYIKAAYKGKFGKILSSLFAVFIILALGIMGNMVQSNSIANAFANSFNVKPYIIGIFVALISGFIFLGGISRIASVTEKVVPIMAISYLLGAAIVVALNITKVPNAFAVIFQSAFNPQAIIGGSLGITIQQAMRFGIARGLFSNEAGMGSTPHAHAIAKVKHPCEQGIVAIMGVFCTFIVITLTALVILTSGILQEYIYPLSSHDLIPEMYNGIGLAQEAFQTKFGYFGIIFIAICLLFFAFSTIIAWYFFGEQNFKYLFGTKLKRLYSLIVIVFVFIGSILKVDLVWALSDCFNGLMVIPNILALLALSPIVFKAAKDYKNINKK